MAARSAMSPTGCSSPTGTAPRLSSADLARGTRRRALGRGWEPARLRFPERAAVGLWCGGAPGTEMMTERGRGPEPRAFRYHVHRLIGLLEQLLRQQDALTDQPALRRCARLLDETASERAWRHRGELGQLIYRDEPVDVALHPLDEIAERVAGRLANRSVDELRLTAIPVRRHDHPTRDRVGDAAALLIAHQVQA